MASCVRAACRGSGSTTYFEVLDLFTALTADLPSQQEAFMDGELESALPTDHEPIVISSADSVIVLSGESADGIPVTEEASTTHDFPASHEDSNNPPPTEAAQLLLCLLPQDAQDEALEHVEGIALNSPSLNVAVQATSSVAQGKP